MKSSRSCFLPRSLFNALLLLLLLKDQVHGAFTQSFGGGTSSSTSRKFKSTSAPILLWGRPQPPSSSSLAGHNGDKAPTTTTALSATANNNGEKFQHVLAILTMPYTSMDRIANEAVLQEALQHTSKLSIELRCEGGKAPSLASLRRYVGEVYSQLWDFAMASEDAVHFNDVVVYPQNLPNAAAEQWIYHRKDLDAICSHESICGWISEEAQGRGTQFQFLEGGGVGGLDTHVEAVNADRLGRNLKAVEALHVANWPLSASSTHLTKENVVFVDDELPVAASSIANANGDDTAYDDDDDNDEDGSIAVLLGGARIPDKSLFNCVAVGGTFDGMHYGHRKLLTLAVSSVIPVTGKLIVGVTVDEMLTSKQYAEYIPSLRERMEGVRKFLHRLAPGMKNRIIIEPISDAYGPPGKESTGKEFDALVLSHETLENGVKLNRHRQETFGYEPLTLLCTRRTEAYGMSSTTLRRLRSMSKVGNALDRV